MKSTSAQCLHRAVIAACALFISGCGDSGEDPTAVISRLVATDATDIERTTFESLHRVHVSFRHQRSQLDPLISQEQRLDLSRHGWRECAAANEWMRIPDGSRSPPVVAFQQVAMFRSSTSMLTVSGRYLAAWDGSSTLPSLPDTNYRQVDLIYVTYESDAELQLVLSKLEVDCAHTR